MGRDGKVLAGRQQTHAGGVEINGAGIFRSSCCTGKGIAHAAAALFDQGEAAGIGDARKGGEC